MPNHRLPRSLLADRQALRVWLEDIPTLDPDGYVPIGRFREKLRDHLDSAPAGSFSYDEAEALRAWFARVLRPARRRIRDAKLKTVISYIATAAPIVADFLVTGGVGTAVALATGIIGATTVAVDVAHSKSSARLDDVEDIFDAWLESRT